MRRCLTIEGATEIDVTLINDTRLSSNSKYHINFFTYRNNQPQFRAKPM